MDDWVGELSGRVTVLARAADLPLLLGRFRCAPDDPAWRQVNRVGDVAHVVFPRTAVEITPVGATAMAADANRVLLYRAGDEYRRRPLDPRGDDCLFVALGDAAVDALDARGTLAGHDGGPRDRPSPAAAWAALRSLATIAPDADPLVVDEALVDAVTGVLAGDERPAQAPDPLAEEVRRLLARRVHEPLSLAAVGAAVGVSPYHLHRRFRAATGWTIHDYRDHLRLREGLARVLDGAPDLARVATELGYASHSHFTARFRRAFGVPPSAVRRQGVPHTARS